MKNKISQEICTFTLFRFERKEMLWIFAQMQTSLPKFSQIQGLKFFKLMGSGGKKGFSKILNPAVYAFHGVWKSEEDAENYFKRSTHFKEFKIRASEIFTVFMRTTKSHGLWSGLNPYSQTFPYQEGKIAVITRARIKMRYVPKFWSYVPTVSDSLEKQPGSIFSIGIGEYPWFMQATFSLWEDTASMQNFAYENKLHAEVIRKTRELGWYKEELFANFSPYRSKGTWNGTNLLTSKENPIIHF
jgi:heme-degrading monooxygenase HmoA